MTRKRTHGRYNSTINSKRDRGRRRNAPTFDTDDWTDADFALAARSRMRCEIGGEPLNRHYVERHHRQRKQVGGDRLANLIYACSEHHHYAHEHPEWARLRGFIVSALGLSDPADVPMLLWGDTWVLLDDDGGSRAAELDCIPDLTS